LSTTQIKSMDIPQGGNVGDSSIA